MKHVWYEVGVWRKFIKMREGTALGVLGAIHSLTSILPGRPCSTPSCVRGLRVLNSYFVGEGTSQALMRVGLVSWYFPYGEEAGGQRAALSLPVSALGTEM